MTQYKGNRYVPKLMGEWDNTIKYESLMIVEYQGASYTSKQIVPVGVDILNEVFWVCTGNYNAQIELYRANVDEYKLLVENAIDSIDKIDSSLSDIKNNITITPDDFEGNDIEKIQQAYDHCVNNSISIIKLNRSYDLTGGTINISLINWSREIWFMGGELIKTDAGFMFSRLVDDNGINAPRFYQVRFEGSQTNIVIVLDGDRMLRSVTNNCTFMYISLTHSTKYTQSIRMNLCEMHYATDSFIKAPINLDLVLTGCQFESSKSHLIEAICEQTQVFAISVARITDCLIEGYRYASPIKISSAIGLKIQGTYFEANMLDIEIVKSINGSKNIQGSIIDNTFFGTLSNTNIQIEGGINLSRLRVENNTSNIPLNDNNYFMSRVPGYYDNNYLYGSGNLFPINIDYNYDSLLGRVATAWTKSVFPVLLNNWIGGLSYSKSNSGMVSLEFSITSGTITANTTITTLPNGFRPAQVTPITVRDISGGTVPLALYLHTDGRLLTSQGNTLSISSTYTGTILYKGN